jgi:replicative DNA helicase
MRPAVESGHFIEAIASLESEYGVLGVLLLDNGAYDRIGDMLRPEHFFNETNRAIYSEICAQLNAAKSCDVITVSIALKGQVDLSELNRLAQFVPSGAHIRRYAETVIERSKSRSLLAVSAEISELAQDHGSSIEDRVELAQGQLVRLIDQTPQDDWIGVSDGMALHCTVLEERAEGISNAIPTGLPDLDDYLSGGVRPGSLVIIGARPSMGKTALAMTMATHMAARHAVGMLSMEMPHTELRDRLTAMLGRISLSSVMRPRHYGGLDWGRVTDGIELARGLNFHVSDQGSLTINQVRSKARNLRRVRGVEVLIVDYIGLMSGLDTRQPRAYQLEEISRGLKTLAKELGIAVVCLAQVNRKVEERVDHMPNLSDLRDSGAIEQDADVVLFVHRPIQSRPDMGEQWRNYAKCTVAKNRQGRCGVLHLSYIGEQTRFDGWHGPAPVASGRSFSGADL